MRATSVKFLSALNVIGVAFAGLLSCESNGQETRAANEARVTIKLPAAKPGAAILADFTGVGFEVAILREENGTRYFRPDNKPLIHLFHTLGIKSLRLGGNTSDRDVRQLPSEADLDSLFGFAKAADV